MSFEASSTARPSAEVQDIFSGETLTQEEALRRQNAHYEALGKEGGMRLMPESDDGSHVEQSLYGRGGDNHYKEQDYSLNYGGVDLNQDFAEPHYQIGGITFEPSTTEAQTAASEDHASAEASKVWQHLKEEDAQIKKNEAVVAAVAQSADQTEMLIKKARDEENDLTPNPEREARQLVMARDLIRKHIAESDIANKPFDPERFRTRQSQPETIESEIEVVSATTPDAVVAKDAATTDGSAGVVESRPVAAETDSEAEEEDDVFTAQQAATSPFPPEEPYTGGFPAVAEEVMDQKKANVPEGVSSETLAEIENLTRDIELYLQQKEVAYPDAITVTLDRAHLMRLLRELSQLISGDGMSVGSDERGVLIQEKMDEVKKIKAKQDALLSLDIDKLSFDEMTRHPVARSVLDEEALRYLKNDQADYLYSRYNGRVDENGYLLDKNGRVTATLPIQCIGGREMNMIEQRVRDRLKRMGYQPAKDEAILENDIETEAVPSQTEAKAEKAAENEVGVEFETEIGAMTQAAETFTTTAAEQHGSGDAFDPKPIYDELRSLRAEVAASAEAIDRDAFRSDLQNRKRFRRAEEELATMVSAYLSDPDPAPEVLQTIEEKRMNIRNIRDAIIAHEQSARDDKETTAPAGNDTESPMENADIPVTERADMLVAEIAAQLEKTKDVHKGSTQVLGARYRLSQAMHSLKELVERSKSSKNEAVLAKEWPELQKSILKKQEELDNWIKTLDNLYGKTAVAESAMDASVQIGYGSQEQTFTYGEGAQEMLDKAAATEDQASKTHENSAVDAGAVDKVPEIVAPESEETGSEADADEVDTRSDTSERKIPVTSEPPRSSRTAEVVIDDEKGAEPEVEPESEAELPELEVASEQTLEEQARIARLVEIKEEILRDPDLEVQLQRYTKTIEDQLLKDFQSIQTDERKSMWDGGWWSALGLGIRTRKLDSLYRIDQHSAPQKFAYFEDLTNFAISECAELAEDVFGDASIPNLDIEPESEKMTVEEYLSQIARQLALVEMTERRFNEQYPEVA